MALIGRFAGRRTLLCLQSEAGGHLASGGGGMLAPKMPLQGGADAELSAKQLFCRRNTGAYSAPCTYGISTIHRAKQECMLLDFIYLFSSIYLVFIPNSDFNCA